MARLFTPAQPPLVVPGTNDRVLRRPDLRDMVIPRPSAAPLSSGEIDYDDVITHRSWRTYHDDTPGEVRYFMYELSQRNPGQSVYSDVFYKAVRMIRLTRVPRYLRMVSSSGPDMVFEQMRDVLAALREQGVLFVNVIAKSPQMPLVFAYGVQGIGATIEEAQRVADEAYAVLDFQLSGTYQQLMYKPISFEEGELIARYQKEWGHVAVGRGRPLPQSGTVGVSSLLDGNRSDVESANNQLESFIRGMSDKSFLLTMITVPLSPAEITVAWRNITEKLSEVRSETSGARSLHAGVAFPLTVGASAGDSHGNTHQATATYGTAFTDSQSESDSTGSSSTSTNGVSDTKSTSTTDTSSFGTSETLTGTESSAVNRSLADGTSESAGRTDSMSLTDSSTQGVSSSSASSTSSTLSLGDSYSLAQGSGVTSTNGVSSSATVTTGSTVGNNWSNSLGQSFSAGTSYNEGYGSSSTGGGSSTSSSSTTVGDSSGWNSGTNSSSGVTGGVPIVGIGGTNTSGMNDGVSGGTTSSATDSSSATSSWSSTNSSNVSNGTSTSQGLNLGESYGGSMATSATAANAVGSNQSMAVNSSQTATQGATSTQSEGVSRTQNLGTSLNQGQSLGQSNALSNTLGVTRVGTLGDSQGVSVANAQGVTQGASQAFGTSNAFQQSQSVAQGTSLTQTDGTGRSASTNQNFGDGYAVALTRNTGQTGSLAVAPNFGVSISRNTLDAGKQYIGDLLEAQMRRYDEGIKSGAFLYQMFLICPDRETLLGGAGLLKSAFWGAGRSGDPLPQPFHTIVDFEPAEQKRLLDHAGAFTSYRKRNPYVEMIEPFLYSSYLTPTEGAALTHPPTVEGPGLLAVHDSMPVMRIPTDRQECEVTLGYVVNGERGVVSDIAFGVNLDDIKNHALIAGVTGSGKTTTLMRMLTEAVSIERTVVDSPTSDRPFPVSRPVSASILALDWMRNMRNLASIPGLVESGRFRFYSLVKPELGPFRWNPLEVPADGMTTAEWLNAQADNFTAAFNLGEFGRSLIAEFLTDLYGANRLEPYILRPELVDEYTGQVIRPAEVLPPIPREQIPDSGIGVGPDGSPIATAFTYAPLSRCVSMAHLATLVATKIEQVADPNVKRLYGTDMSNRLQSLWRRMQYFAPGGQYEGMLACDTDLDTRQCLSVTDLINPDRGLVTVLETDGLDLEARRLVLGSVLLAIYRYGLHFGNGVFDHDGRGPGCFVVMEESHELFGEAGRNEDAYSAATRTGLYESMFRRVRALGLRLIAVAQEPSKLPESVTANINNVFLHKVRAKEDRDKAFSLLNWSNMIGQNMREWRYLGEMPVGYCIARLDAQEDYIESAPVQFRTDPPSLTDVPDDALRTLAQRGSR